MIQRQISISPLRANIFARRAFSNKMSDLKLLVKKLSENATLPVRGSPGAAGYDLSSAKKMLVPAGGKAIVPTDLSIVCPPGPKHTRMRMRICFFRFGLHDWCASIFPVHSNHEIDNTWIIGTYGRVAPRSGLAWKKHIDVGAGVIDEDYRGPVGVVLFNHGKEDLEGHHPLPSFLPGHLLALRKWSLVMYTIVPILFL